MHIFLFLLALAIFCYFVPSDSRGRILTRLWLVLSALWAICCVWGGGSAPAVVYYGIAAAPFLAGLLVRFIATGRI